MFSNESQNEVMKQGKQPTWQQQQRREINREIIETYVSVRIVCLCL